MKKFTQYKPVVTTETELKRLCEENLHVGINGPIEPLLAGQITVEGLEPLIESIEIYVDKKVGEKLKVLLEEAKNRALAGDLKWFDQKIEEANDTV
jgi:hypothetical protein